MKKWAFILCCVLSLGFILVGCGSDGTVLGANDELYFNGPSATIVGDYLYFGNGMYDTYKTTGSLSNNNDYNAAKGLAYLARLNVNAEKFSSKGIDYSPNGVSKIGNEVATYTNDSGINSFSFVIGNYIFYATPNTWQTTGGEFNFGWTTFYRSRLDGSDKKEIYSTRDLGQVVTKAEVLKFGGKYYLLMLAGTNLVRLNLTNGGAQTLSGVTSVAMPKTYQKTILGSTTDWNGVLYYTKNSDISDVTYNEVYTVSISDLNSGAKKISALTGAGNGGALTFIDREIGYVNGELLDEIFFTRDGSTYKMTKEVEVDDETHEERTFHKVETFVERSSLSGAKIYRIVTERYSENQEIKLAVEGYAYESAGQLHYVLDKDSDKAISFVDESGSDISYNRVVSVDGGWVVLLGANSIYRAEITPVLKGGENKIVAKTIVTMESGIFTDQNMASYDGEYVYYYAKLNDIEAEEDDEDGARTGNDDENYYMCRSSLAASLYGEENYQFLGVTNTPYRHS